MASRGYQVQAGDEGVDRLGATDEGSDDEGVSREETFTLLSNRRRRYALHMLTDDDLEEPFELGEIAEQVAAWENDVPVERLSSNQRKRAYTALQQTHLPKMSEAGVVDFDKDRGVVRPTEAIEDVDIYLEVVSGRDIPWSSYNLALGVTSIALVAALWVDAWPFVLLPDLAWTAGVAVAFTVSAAIHVYYTQYMRLSDQDVPPELDE
jgi:hypothetical protein